MRPFGRIAACQHRVYRVELSQIAGMSHQEIIEQIRDKITRNQYEFSQHAVDQSILRIIKVQELREAITNCEMIEDYPDDKYGPSCLLLGFTAAHRPLHIQCSYPSRPLVKIITLYEPDPKLWINFRIRRPHDDE